MIAGWLELRRLPRRVWIISAAALVNRAGTMALPFMTLYLTSSLGWPAPRAAAVLGLYGGVALIAGPFAGRLSDRFGASLVMRTSLALAGLLAILFPAARSLSGVAAMTVVWAVFSEAFRPANMTAIMESVVPAQRKQAYALHRTAINLGMSVGPALGGVLAAHSYSWLWWIDGGTSLAAVALLWRGLRDLPTASSGENPAGLSAAALSDPRFLGFMLAMVPASLVFFQHESSLPLHLARALGTSPTFYGLLFTVNTLLIVAVEIPLNHATALWSHRRTLAAGAALIGMGFGAYGLATRPWHAVAATALWTFGEMLFMPGSSAFVSEIAPEDRRGEYMGLFIMTYSAGFMLGPWLGVLTMVRLGAPVLWSGCLLCGGISAALFYRVAGQGQGSR